MTTNLIIYTPENRAGKHDGDEFTREAHAFASVHGGYLLPLTGPKRQRQKQLRAKLSDCEDVGVECIAYFGHGVRSGLVHLTRDAEQFAEWIAPCSSDRLTVIMYACLSGPKFGLALQQALEAEGIIAKVYGHTTAGHTTRNPHVVAWPNDDHTGYLVRPGSDLWDPWRRALEADGFRLRFPFWGRNDIELFLRGVDPCLCEEPRRAVYPVGLTKGPKP